MSFRHAWISAAIAGVALVAVIPQSAVAQISDAGTVTASVTVESVPVSVTGLQDLAFGTHFASEGLVQNQADGEWSVEGPIDASVDLSFSMLPSSLANNGNDVAVSYGATSMGVWCDDGAGNITGQFMDPASGFNGCLLGAAGSILVELGNGAGADGWVTVDLTGAPDGTYTAIIELTATVN
jgi:hypothetical protein